MDEPSEDAEPFTGADVMEEHAIALGLLCIYWATLDNAVAELLNNYLNSAPIGAAVVAPDISTRCEQVRKLAHVSGPSGEWRECLLHILNMIQGEMAEARNRYVHDDWNISEAGMVRIDRRPKLKKPQAREAVQLITQTETVVPSEWIYQLTNRVVDTMVAIAFMTIDIRRWRKEGLTLAPPPQALALRNSKSLAELRPKAPARWTRQPPPLRGR
jgi:hypothetical protein